MAPKDKRPSTPGSPKGESFSSPNHPSYSSFSHIGDMSDLTFAVGLREEEDAIDEAIGRIIPMSRIVPGAPIEKRAPPEPKEVGECENPECIARQARYRELMSANAPLRAQYDELEMQLKTTMNKIQLVDHANKLVEENNDKLQEQLEEIRCRTSVLETETQEGAKVHNTLKAKYEGLKTEIEMLKAQTEDRRRQKEAAEKSCEVEVIFGPPPCHSTPERQEVARLEGWRRPGGRGSRKPLRAGGGRGGGLPLRGAGDGRDDADGASSVGSDMEAHAARRRFPLAASPVQPRSRPVSNASRR